MEIWKIINGFDDYMASNFGRVKSLKKGKERILKPRKDSGGYLQVDLYKDGKHHWTLVHRLVAELFLSNPNNLPQVNHINEDKTDNRLENLEYCDRQYNIDYSQSKAVAQFTLDGKKVNEFKSAIEAARQLGFNQGNISHCCLGKYKQAYGFKWQYKYENE